MKTYKAWFVNILFDQGDSICEEFTTRRAAVAFADEYELDPNVCFIELFQAVRPDYSSLYAS